MGKLKVLIWPALTTLLTAVLIVFYSGWQHWLAVHTGSLNTSGTPPNYNYWSGFGSVFPWSLGILAGLWTYVYQHTRVINCHTHGCWRLGSYPVGSYKVCKRCHKRVTGKHPTIEHLREVHRGSRPDSDTAGDSGAGDGERDTVSVSVSGSPGYSQPADLPGDTRSARREI